MHGESTHLDEDCNVIASFDDGDNGVYMHCNGTTASDIQGHNYYQSGETGTNVTDGGGTQIAGMEVSVSARKEESIIQRGIRATFIIGFGITTGRGTLNDQYGNERTYGDFGLGLDIGIGYEVVKHTTTAYIPYGGAKPFTIDDNMEGSGISHNFGFGPVGISRGGNSGSTYINFDNYGNDYKSRSLGPFQSKFEIGYSLTGTRTYLDN